MSKPNTFQQEREAFSMSPDPAYLYRSGEHLSILNRLEISIRLRQGLSIVVGDVGTGKTTLARTLIESFIGEEERYVFHMLLDPFFRTEAQLLAHLTALFGISHFDRSSIEHHQMIERYLLKKKTEEEKTVTLIVDEGQRLAAEHFKILKTFVKFGKNELPLLQLIIFVQAQALNAHNVFEGIEPHYLAPLDEYDTGKLIAFRLKKAGRTDADQLFTKEAIKNIHAFTRGYPRRTMLVCHRALEKLTAKNGGHVTAELIEEVVAEEMAFH